MTMATYLTRYFTRTANNGPFFLQPFFYLDSFSSTNVEYFTVVLNQKLEKVLPNLLL